MAHQLATEILSGGALRGAFATEPASASDLRALKSASAIAGCVLRPGGLVVFESTVYPGATEEVCAPIIAERSGLAELCRFPNRSRH